MYKESLQQNHILVADCFRMCSHIPRGTCWLSFALRNISEKKFEKYCLGLMSANFHPRREKIHIFFLQNSILLVSTFRLLSRGWELMAHRMDLAGISMHVFYGFACFKNSKNQINISILGLSWNSNATLSYQSSRGIREVQHGVCYTNGSLTWVSSESLERLVTTQNAPVHIRFLIQKVGVGTKDLNLKQVLRWWSCCCCCCWPGHHPTWRNTALKDWNTLISFHQGNHWQNWVPACHLGESRWSPFCHSFYQSLLLILAHMAR